MNTSAALLFALRLLRPPFAFYYGWDDPSGITAVRRLRPGLRLPSAPTGLQELSELDIVRSGQCGLVPGPGPGRSQTDRPVSGSEPDRGEFTGFRAARRDGQDHGPARKK